MKNPQRKRLRHTGLLPLLTALLTACWLAGAARPAAAAGTYTVINTLDDGSAGTLRSAIALANDDPGAAIVFSPGVSGVIALQSELDLSASMTIFGPGAGVVQVDGGGATRLFSITSSTAQVALYSLGLQNGSALNDPNGLTSGAGGAVYNGGTLTLINCAFSGSIASFGGAVYSDGSLAIALCSFSDNGVGDDGGGGAVYNDNDGSMSAFSSSFSGNGAFYAGGLYNGGGMFLANCTIDGGSAFADEAGNSGLGGGLYNDGGVTLAACVVCGNAAYGGSADDGGAGGGLFNGSGATLTLAGCTLSGNLAFPDVGGQSSGDSATGLGGGLDNQGAVALIDDIFYADIAAFGAEIENDTVNGPGANVTASACDIQGSSAGAGGIGPDISFGLDILDVDPLFVRPVHTGGGADQGDLHLQTDSPCLRAGIADANNGTDRDGNARPNPPALGAYEYPFAPPVANAQGVTTSQNTPVAVTLTGSGSLPLTFQVVSGPANGTLSGTAPNLIYTPNPGYIGPDSFTFTVNNGTLGSSPATVSLSVTYAVAQDVSGQVSVGRGGYFFNRSRNLLQQVLTLTNTGPALAGPVVVAFDGLPQGVAVFRPDGTTQAALPSGSPYLVAVASGGSLASGGSVSVAVSYYDPAHVPAPYTPRVLAGSGD